MGQRLEFRTKIDEVAARGGLGSPMLIRCISVFPDEAQLEALGERFHRLQRFDITQGMTYTVLGLTFYVQSTVYGSGVYAELENDSGQLASAPLLLFEIVDERPSQHWVARLWSDGTFAWWPESFFQHGYHDRLSNGVAEVRRDYELVRLKLEQEARSYLEPQA
jgi:hypothetical protein